MGRSAAERDASGQVGICFSSGARSGVPSSGSDVLTAFSTGAASPDSASCQAGTGVLPGSVPVLRDGITCLRGVTGGLKSGVFSLFSAGTLRGVSSASLS